MLDTASKFNDINEFKKRKDLLLCVDSDGCVMDTMNAKHRRCFGPLLVKEWGLWEHENEVLSLWNNVNLYTKTRGVNRFKGLAITLKTVNSRYRPIDGIGNLIHWTESAELSESSLMREIETNPEVLIFRKALSWSMAANRASEELTCGETGAFVGAREALEHAKKYADIAVVSGASPERLYDEWRGCGLLPFADIMLAQDAGDKSLCLKKLVGKGYLAGTVLMCGDSPGDLEAAEKNSALFYPILAGSEEKSWAEFFAAFDAFVAGRYGEESSIKKAEFLKNLEVETDGRT